MHLYIVLVYTYKAGGNTNKYVPHVPMPADNTIPSPALPMYDAMCRSFLDLLSDWVDEEICFLRSAHNQTPLLPRVSACLPEA